MSELAIRIHVWMSTTLASLKEERGQDLIEYALFGGLLATLIIGRSGFLVVPANNPIQALFNGIEGCIDFTAGGCTRSSLAAFMRAGSKRLEPAHNGHHMLHESLR